MYLRGFRATDIAGKRLRIVFHNVPFQRLEERFLLGGGVFKGVYGIFSAEGVYPVGKAFATEEEPAYEEQECQHSGYYLTEEVVAPKDYLPAEFAPKSSAECRWYAGKVACKSEQQRCNNSPADSEECRLDEGEIPPVAEQPDADGDEDDEQDETSQPEKVAYEKMPGAVT